MRGLMLFVFSLCIATPVFGIGLGVSPSELSKSCFVNESCAIKLRLFNPNPAPIRVAIRLEDNGNWLHTESPFEIPREDWALVEINLLPDRLGVFSERILLYAQEENIQAALGVRATLDVRKRAINSPRVALGIAISLGIATVGLAAMQGFRKLQA